jgi:hypothetical protein
MVDRRGELLPTPSSLLALPCCTDRINQGGRQGHAVYRRALPVGGDAKDICHSTNDAKKRRRQEPVIAMCVRSAALNFRPTG